MNDSRFWNRISKNYDRIIRKDAKAYVKILTMIEPRIKPDMDILEIAAGTGYFAINLAGRCRKYTATDYSLGMVEEMQKKTDSMGASANLVIETADVMDLRYEGGIFDAVVISNALHIVPNPEKALENIRRVLKNDGILIAPTFMRTGGAKERIMGALMKIFGFTTYTDWTPQTYSEFLTGNGWIIDTMETVPSSYPIAFAVLRKKL